MRAVAVACALLVAAALGGCMQAGAATSDTKSGTFPVRGRTAAPALRGDLLGGGSYDSGQHLGEVVVINFWASWCAPCRDEAAELAASYTATRASGVSFLGINIRDERDKALAFLTSHPVAYPSLFDPAGSYALDFKVPPSTTPATLILDRKGRIAAVYRKALIREELIPAIASIAAER